MVMTTQFMRIGDRVKHIRLGVGTVDGVRYSGVQFTVKYDLPYNRQIWYNTNHRCTDLQLISR